MVAVHFLNYNFVREHSTIKDAPAVAAGVCDSRYKMADMVEMFDEYRREKYPVNRPSRYKRRATG